MVHVLAALLAFAQQAPDRADLPQVVETWYRVLQGKRCVGYYHETLKRAGTAWRYEYARDGELELSLPRGRSHEEDQSVRALLDDALSPVDLTLEAHANDTLAKLTFYSTRDERRIEARPASGKEVSWNQESREDFHVLPTLTLYALRQNETLAKPGRVTLRVLDPRGEDKGGLEVVLEVGERARRTILGREVPGTPVAFLKPFPAAARETELREAFVDHYGRILEATMAGGVRIVIAADQAEALAELGPVHRHGRRDPMDKLTAMKNAALERAKALRGELDPQVPPPTLDSLMSDFVGVQKALEQVRALKADRELEEARQTYLRALVQLKAIRELAAKRRPELLPEIDKTRDDAELAWDGAAQVEREAGLLYVQVEALLGRLDCEGVERTHKELQALRDRIEVERRPERDSIATKAADVGALVLKCRTRRDLAQVRLDLTGILMGEKTTLETVELPLRADQEVKFQRSFAWAEINGQVYRVGDTIAGTQVRVDKITRHSVQVSLRDEMRDVGLRR